MEPGRGGQRRGGSRAPRSGANVAPFGESERPASFQHKDRTDSSGERRNLRQQANQVVRGGYRKKPRLQNITSFGEALGSGESLPSAPVVAPQVTFDSLREKQREQNERLLSQLAAQLDDDSEEEDDLYASGELSAAASSANPLSSSIEKPVYAVESCQICLDRVRFFAPSSPSFLLGSLSIFRNFLCLFCRCGQSRLFGCVRLVSAISFICTASNPG